MSEQGADVSYGFRLRALRLNNPPNETTDVKQSLDLGIRLARLAAEAPIDACRSRSSRICGGRSDTRCRR